MAKFSRIILIILVIFSGFLANAQVNSVTFGKNRVQFKKFKWQFYQTRNFNVFFNQNGQELAKFVAQSAEKELPDLEATAEYSLQRRANIILYNEFADMQQTNIGLESDLLTTGGTTRLVNNKMVIYFDANHANLRRQIRQGIADVITKNVLFGDDIGEVAGNQTLLDLPQWLTDGYVAYLGENWSTELDDELKSEILSGNYSRFSSFSYAKPLLAGHAFWFFIEEKYKKENVTYFLYLARVYKNLNKASVQITKKKFKELLTEFMEYQEDKYYKDITRRKAYPKGSYIEGFDISKRLNYYRFNVNPNKRNNSYVVTQFKKGIVRVILNEDYENKTLLKYGIRTYQNQVNPNYPLMAWDPKGTRVSVVYVQEGRLKLFVYDIITRIKQYKIDLTADFDQVQDIKYMLDSRTLLISAVKNGHTDIYTYNIEKEKAQQITNDVFDDLDPSFVSFPNKTGIIYSSNRPSAEAKTADTILPSDNRYNIFLITDFGDKPELNQISQLSNLKYGNARFPTQYNVNHFTFVSDENGVGNRYAGFFTTEKAGLDTLVLIGDDILRNPSVKDIDSALRAYNKTDVDSIAVVSVSQDSAYTFPLSNYQSTLGETRIAGENNQVSEVTRQSDEKVLYKLKIDENTLRQRNISVPPTEYMKKLMRESRLTKVNNSNVNPTDTIKRQEDFFQNDIDLQKKDSSSVTIAEPTATESVEVSESVLRSAKLFRYRPLKFSGDFGSVGFNNAVLINRYQAYAGGSGPIMLNSGTPLNGLISLGTSDLLEDIKILGAFKISTNLKDNEWYVSYQNYKRRIDWGLSYYRNTQSVDILPTDVSGNPIHPFASPGKVFTNLYQVNVAYPFDATKSVRLSTGLRSDNVVISNDPNFPNEIFENNQKKYSVTHFEYVYDNSLNPNMNIWNGLRYKAFFDWNRQLTGPKREGPTTFNFGFDARYYYPIHRDFIWAVRAAGDFSWGNQKFIYYLGGVDGWLMFGSNEKRDNNQNLVRERYFNTANQPDNDQDYAFQSLAVNMRGYIQNVANGNNSVVINSELRLPVMSTFFDRTVNNAFLRNFQLIQFIDLGSAWNGGYDKLKRPTVSYHTDNVTVKTKAGGVGPFAGGYGFGARSTLLGYFLKYDVGWPMSGFFKGRPVMYLALGLDF
ncbi:MAG: hypothetical protein ABIO04_14070 [Ferruginibacter sp.]